MAQPAKIRKFNPGLYQSDAAVKKDFVVRHEAFEKVMEVIEGNLEGPSCEHVLLVGARGQGKTMLLARVKAELTSPPRHRKSLARDLLPIRFMEESYEIWNVADFWLEAMAYTAGALGDEARAGDLRTERRLLAESDAAPRTIAKAAREAVLEAAGGRKLVLMIENLEPLCDAVAGRGRIRRTGIGWLRETLAPCRERVMVLATATSLFEGLGRRQTFFKTTISLPPLDTNGCEALLAHLGQKRKDAKALEILTGGNPRLLAIVGSFAHEASIDRLTNDLVSLIDEHTDYFKNYLENLARGERRVFVALADLWRPATTKEVAARTRMDRRTASALLSKLTDDGVVRKERGHDGKFRYFATMRLVSIYHKLRRGGDKDVVMPSLFRFMTVCYAEAPEVAAKLHDSVLSETGLTEETQREVSEIIASALNEAAARKDARGLLADSEEVLRRFGGNGRGPASQLATAGTQKGYAHAELCNHEGALAAWNEVISSYSESDDLETRAQVAWALLGTANIHRVEDDPKRAAESYDRALSMLEESTDPALRLVAGRALLLRGAHHVDCNATEEARESFEQAFRALDVQSNLGERLSWYAIVCLTALQPNVNAQYAQRVYDPVVQRLRQDSPTTATVANETASPPDKGWYTRWLRANILLALDEHAAALEMFHQAYLYYDPTDAKMIDGLLAFADQVAAVDSDSLSERLQQMLASDKEKAQHISPLVWALGGVEGAKHANLSAEVMAFSNDLRARFERVRRRRAALRSTRKVAPRLVSNLLVKALDEAERLWDRWKRS